MLSATTTRVERRGHLLGDAGDGIGDDELIDRVQRREVSRVERADSA